MPLKSHQLLHQVSAKGFVSYLVDKGLIKPGFNQVLSGKTIGEIKHYVVEKGLIDPIRLVELMSEYYQLPYTRLVDHPIDAKVAQLLNRDVINQYKAMPIKLSDRVLTLAITDPTMLQQNAPKALTRLRQEKGLTVQLVIVPEGDFRAVLEKVYPHPIERPHHVEKVERHEPTSMPIHKPNESLAETIADQPPVEPSRPDVLKKVESRGKTVDLRTLTIDPKVISRIPYDVAKKYQLVVFGLNDGRSQFEPAMIKVAMVHPEDEHVREIISYIEQRNKILVDKYHTDEASLEAALGYYPQSTTSATNPTPEKPTEKSPAAQPKAAEPIVAVPTQPTTVPTSVPVEPVKALPGAIIREESVSPEAGVVTLSDSDIINKPAQQSSKDLAQLAAEQRETLEDQNLDKLIHQPIRSVQDLAVVFRSGIVPEIVAATLLLAVKMRASDVHIESEKAVVKFRYRIDGILYDILRVPAFLHAPLISRIKILAKMKIDESRVPQDGRFDVEIDKRQIDLRVSTLPTVHGEKIVMRLLDKSEAMLTLEQLGLTGSNFDTLIKNIAKPYGIILSTGPTGSGKSTTLYSILSRISRPGINIITLEDPVEYELPGLNQAQVMPQIGFTFADGLRSVLRQDPNVIMVGEIRDLETAAMSTQAALTGHLVLSTLHTNDAAGALPRLIDMGVEPFLITSSLSAVVGQRLVRRICEKCRDKAEIPGAVLTKVQQELSTIPSGQLKNIDLNQLTFYHGRGCPDCTDGYKGRVGIFEVMEMNEEIENLAVKKSAPSELQRAAVKGGMMTMVQDGLIKALKGITTVDEILRVTMSSIKEVPGTGG